MQKKYWGESGVIMAGKLWVIGIGPGDRDYIYPRALNIIEKSNVLIGGKRNLELFSHLDKEQVPVGNNLEAIVSYISNNIREKSIAVLATGDPGIYSISEYLKEGLKDVELEVLPGISSLQYLCSKLRLAWHDIYITSLHGREVEDLADLIRSKKKVAVFAGGKCTPDAICRELVQKGVKGLKISVGENLSYPNERIIVGSPDEIGRMQFESLSIMIIEHNDVNKSGVVLPHWKYTTHGIPDDMFIRGDVPMTKEEVRAVSLSRLRLNADSLVYDIGAGTGSVSVECGLQCTKGKVFAIEKEADAVELVKANCIKFGLTNVEVIHGAAPDAFIGLPSPNRVFIGGSAGNMEEILKQVTRFGNPVRVVINSVTIESTYEALQGLENCGFNEIDIVSVSISRGRAAGGRHLMQALNPVYVISGEKC